MFRVSQILRISRAVLGEGGEWVSNILYTSPLNGAPVFLPGARPGYYDGAKTQLYSARPRRRAAVLNRPSRGGAGETYTAIFIEVDITNRY